MKMISIIPNVGDVVDGFTQVQSTSYGGKGGTDKSVPLKENEQIVSAKYVRVKKPGDYWQGAIIKIVFKTNLGIEYSVKTGMSNNYKESDCETIEISAPAGKFIAAFKGSNASAARHKTPVLGSLEIDHTESL